VWHLITYPDLSFHDVGNVDEYSCFRQEEGLVGRQQASFSTSLSTVYSIPVVANVVFFCIKMVKHDKKILELKN